MTKLKREGFYRELRHGDPDGPSIYEAVQTIPRPEESKILQYLRSGIIFIISPMIVKNILHPDEGDPVPMYTLTDGVWTWPNDLQLYVERDHVKLSEEFVKHMADMNWTPPPEGSIQLRELAEKELAADS